MIQSPGMSDFSLLIQRSGLVEKLAVRGKEREEAEIFYFCWAYLNPECRSPELWHGNTVAEPNKDQLYYDSKDS